MSDDDIEVTEKRDPFEIAEEIRDVQREVLDDFPEDLPFGVVEMVCNGILQDLKRHILLT